MEESETRPSLGRRALALLILGLCAWVLVKVLIGIVTAVFWTVAVVIAVVGVIWALRTIL